MQPYVTLSDYVLSENSILSAHMHLLLLCKKESLQNKWDSEAIPLTILPSPFDIVDHGCSLVVLFLR
jgi:hypothetical protein